MKTANRTMQIWRIVIRSRNGISSPEVARAANLGLRTTQRYLKSLIEVGAIYRKSRKYYGY